MRQKNYESWLAVYTVKSYGTAIYGKPLTRLFWPTLAFTTGFKFRNHACGVTPWTQPVAQCACVMAISPVGSVWRAFNVLTTKFQNLRFDYRETKVERSNLAANLLDRWSGKFSDL